MEEFNYNNCFTCNIFVNLFEHRFYIAQDTVNNKSYYLCPKCFNIASKRWDLYNPYGLTTGEVYNYVTSVVADDYQRQMMNLFNKDQNLVDLGNTIGQLQVKLASYQSQFEDHLISPQDLFDQLTDIQIILNTTKSNLTNEIAKLENTLNVTGITPSISENLRQTFQQIHNIMLSTEIEVEHLLSEAYNLCYQSSLNQVGYTPDYQNNYDQKTYSNYNLNHNSFSKY